jgi:tetratricopeptide (TPR) repeat protein
LDWLTYLTESSAAQRQWLDIFFRQLLTGFALENAVEQKTRLRQALEVAQRLNATGTPLAVDQAHLAHVWLWLGRVHYTLGEFGPARMFLEQALTQPNAGPIVALQVAATLGVLYSIHGQYARAVPLLQQALDALNPTDQPFEWVMAAGGLGSALTLQGDLPAAESLLLQMQAFAEMQHYQTGVAYAHVGLGMAAFWRNQLEDALAQFRTGRELAIQAENWTVAVAGIVFEAWTLSRLGQQAAALACLEHHDDLAKQYAAQSGALWRLAVGAEAELNTGNFNGALQQAQLTVSLAEQYENLFIAGLGHRLWAQALPKESPDVIVHLRASQAAFEQGGAQIEAARSRILVDNI